MSDEADVAQEATDEVVQTEVEQTEAPEAAESTKGQVKDQPAEDEGDMPKAEDEEEVSPSKARRERRKAQMDQLRKEAAEAQQKLAETQARLDRIKQASAEMTPPKEADFSDYNEYLMAAAAWQAGKAFDSRTESDIQREAEQHQKSLERVQQQRRAEAQQNWAAQADEARGKYADFDAVVSAPDLTITPSMAELLTASDAGADVAYHLGTNKALARQIAVLTPLEQAMAIGRLEAVVSQPRPRIQTNAPDPVNPVRAKSTGIKDPGKMTMAEYKAARAAGKI